MAAQSVAVRDAGYKIKSSYHEAVFVPSASSDLTYHVARAGARRGGGPTTAILVSSPKKIEGPR